uniref:Exocyst complex component Sec3 PIP2-binding N-terminal domain-containing protein n=1 Tax=Strigamia maritima TaxID=126957 RepID=T1JC86_STRMM
MTAIRHTLHKDLFRPNSERLLAICHVAKASKKKKMSVLCIAVTTEKPFAVNIYQVKKSDKDVYKKKCSWTLRQLQEIDGKEEAKDTNEFELKFEKVYKWAASNINERNSFILCLWKTCCQYLPNKKPKFNHMPERLLEDPILTPEVELSSQPIGEEDAIEMEDYQDLTEKEETGVEKLMSQCEFAISNAEAFTEQLSKDLSILDGTNIHTIMASEKEVEHLIQMIQGAIDEAVKIETKLDAYTDVVKNVQNNIEKMEEKNLLIKIENANNTKLLEELDNLVSQLDLDHKHQVALLDSDLTNPGNISACIAAANALQKALNAKVPAALMKMNAYQEQQKFLEKFRTKFSQRLARHLNNLFIHLGNELGASLSVYAVELTLPKHVLRHKDLVVYADLMNWLRNVEYSSYEALSKTYTSSLRKLYDRDIREFFDNAKQTISGKSEKEKKGKSGSSQDLNGSVVVNKPKASSLLAVEKDVFGSEMDLSERRKFDMLLERMLSELEPVCLAEQQFCIKFFKHLTDSTSQLTSLQPGIPVVTVTQTANTELMSQKKERQINEEVRRMMGELFPVLESELLTFIGYYEKQDGFYSMYLLVRFSQHVMSAQDTGSFLSMTFANALVQAKRNFDKFMQAQIKSIEDAKLHKKSKCGILPFISNFEDFAQQAETIFKDSDRRIDLDKWYVKLLRTMFDVIPRLAKEHPKTPQEVIMMENYHHLYALLSQLKISCLDNERKEAKQLYNEWLQAYVTKYFGRPLVKLNIFFDGVQNKVAQGIKEEEIGYQLAYSKQELRKVIKEYPGKEVKKGLEHLNKKVEKHLCEDENLLQVVWHSMQEEFIRQYKAIHALIERCYPGSMITVEFTISEILQFFSDIARSH